MTTLSGPSIPHLPGDSTLGLLADGYRFGQRRFDRLGGDAFRARLGLQPVLVVRGARAARWVYEGDRFTRAGAIPATARRLLQDDGSVQTLDGAAHRHRKTLFTDVLDAAGTTALVTAVGEEWDAAIASWADRPSIVLRDEVPLLLTRAVCAWAGVVLDDDVRRAQEFAAMVEHAGSVGPPNWRARARRRSTERWASALVEDARRRGPSSVIAPTPLDRVAGFRDADGRPLPLEVAAVELINLLRPVVAIERFVQFAAWAMIRRPDWRARLRGTDARERRAFTQEVRRYSPFFPALTVRAREDEAWRGEPVRAGALVMLDLFATNRDPGYWREPDRFLPERFLHAPADRAVLVPQGAGEVASGHRCPGEDPTIGVLEESIHALARRALFTTPRQDLSVSLRRFPAAPASGVVLAGVRPHRPGSVTV